MTNPSLENLLREDRTFPPPEAFRAHALVGRRGGLRARPTRTPRPGGPATRSACAGPGPGTASWSGTRRFAKWFVGGQLNVADNCLDRHVEAGHGDKVAYHWEGEPGDTRDDHLRRAARPRSQRFANVLKALGVAKGDRVCIYLPMIPELPVAMLACARIGAIHSVVFAGFSAQSLIDRIDDADAQVRDHGRRRLPQGQRVAAEGRPPTRRWTGPTACAAASWCAAPATRWPWSRAATTGTTTLMADAVRRLPAGADGRRGRALHPLHVGHDREAQGHRPHHRRLPHAGRRHAPAGLRPQARRATCTGARPTSAGSPATATSSTGRWRTSRPRCIVRGRSRPPRQGPLVGRSIARYGVTILYTAPTAIRTFMKWGAGVPAAPRPVLACGCSARVGEPINPEAWIWYRQHIGGGRCPVVDTWWQTETGGAHDHAAAGHHRDCKPGSATRPLPGHQGGGRRRRSGEPVERRPGRLPHPAAALAGDAAHDLGRRRSATSTPTGRASGSDIYFAGDGAKLDEDGDLWLLGRVDDVMNVSGHRISTTEVESALVDHQARRRGRRDRSQRRHHRPGDRRVRHAQGLHHPV